MSIDGVPLITNIKTNEDGLLSYEYADGSKHTRITKLSYLIPPNYPFNIEAMEQFNNLYVFANSYWSD